MIGLILQVFIYLVIALFAIRFASTRLKKMQKKRKPSVFDDKYSKHWKRRF